MYSKTLFLKLLALGSLLLFVTMPSFAKIDLPKIFTNNMVLQQQADAPIWGKATPNKVVKIFTSWNNQTYNVQAGIDGNWKAKLKTPKAGGPYAITISDGKEVKLNNVLIGEVWICSGQSNMEMAVDGDRGKVNNCEQEVASANYPQIRLLHVERAAGNQEQSDIARTKDGWQICSPATIAKFSSVAYFFGRNLHQNLKVPIGLISTSWGGTVAEAWTSSESLELMPDFKEAVQTIKQTPDTVSANNNPNRPSVLFNAMIKPLVPYAIQGAIWYQGESNVSRAYQYRELFPLMIRDWRKQWGMDFPFYFVQLANFMDVNAEPVDSDWAELREAQLQTLHLDKTGMAVTIDIGEAKDIHPKNKQDVGIRLALAARANTYEQEVVFSGPIYRSYQIEGDKIRITFDYSNGGLQVKGGAPLKGFAIAGPDHQFYWADAAIDGNEIVVSSPNVKFPVAVRYAWANNPVCNLVNGADLPASPFRTDDWGRKK